MVSRAPAHSAARLHCRVCVLGGGGRQQMDACMRIHASNETVLGRGCACGCMRVLGCAWVCLGVDVCARVSLFVVLNLRPCPAVRRGLGEPLQYRRAPVVAASGKCGAGLHLRAREQAAGHAHCGGDVRERARGRAGLRRVRRRAARGVARAAARLLGRARAPRGQGQGQGHEGQRSVYVCGHGGVVAHVR